MLNIEIKARVSKPGKIREFLVSRNARFVGTDHQVDTYFRTRSGRLKFREGNIENNLIWYARESKKGPKTSHVILHPVQESAGLKDILKEAMGILTVVRKKREIYFIGNVKFHIDQVDGLGSFMEIEAIDKDGSIGKKRLSEQCRGYMKELGIGEEDLIRDSYSDLLASE